MAFHSLGSRPCWAASESARGLHPLVAIDKFSKWIEALSIAQIKSEQVVLFFTDIVHCFKVPNSIINDNDT
jgi:hypothetical protein